MHIALRIILSPLAPFWWLFAVAKRWIYKVGIKKRYQSSLTTLVVGNLSMGGTGKTPFSIFLIEQLLKREIQVAYLSRGYGRKTKGLIKVAADSTPEQVGDEALMVKMRFPEADVVVCENRKEGLQFLESSSMSRVVVMDDAFQHLRIKADHYFLLTTYEKPFFKDFIFPLGTLREPRFFAKAADSVVVTKAPEGLYSDQNESLNKDQKKYSDLESSTSSVKYTNKLNAVFDLQTIDVGRFNPSNFSNTTETDLNESISPHLTSPAGGRTQSPSTWGRVRDGAKTEHYNRSKFDLINSKETYGNDIHKTKAIGFSGIAHAASFESKLKENFHLEDFIAFGDHHEYTDSDFKLIANSFKKNNSVEILLTTEKDAARLQTLKAKKALGHLPLFYWSVQLEPSKELAAEINNIIENKC
jgi:tetraacyldisaccharide-1-P 4'-kinase